jgi:hypothetical protein
MTPSWSARLESLTDKDIDKISALLEVYVAARHSNHSITFVGMYRTYTDPIWISLNRRSVTVTSAKRDALQSAAAILNKYDANKGRIYIGDGERPV